MSITLSRGRASLSVALRETHSHTVVDPSRPQSRLRNLKSSPLAREDVGKGHADFVKLDLKVSLGCVILAEDGERSEERDPCRVHGHKNDALRAVLWRSNPLLDLPHEETDLARCVSSASNPPLSSC